MKTSWRLAKPIGNSGRLPIVIEINHKIHCQPVIPKAVQWQCNGVDWLCFTNEVKSKMQNLLDEPNLSLHISRFNDILISAAIIHMWKTKQSKKSKPWMALHVQAKICTRNRLRRTIHQNTRTGWMLAVKLPRLSTRPRQIAGTISFKTQCRTQTTQICGKSSKV